jgi:hypothetical protein
MCTNANAMAEEDIIDLLRKSHWCIKNIKEHVEFQNMLFIIPQYSSGHDWADRDKIYTLNRDKVLSTLRLPGAYGLYYIEKIYVKDNYLYAEQNKKIWRSSDGILFSIVE